jgi:hypothetical protein
MAEPGIDPEPHDQWSETLTTIQKGWNYSVMFICCFSKVCQNMFYPHFLQWIPASEKLSPFHSPFQLAAVIFSIREHLRSDC